MRFLTVLLVLIALPVLHLAQTDSPEPRAFAPALQRLLELTPDQVQKVKEANAALAEFLRDELPLLRRMDKAHREALRPENLQSNFNQIAQTAINLETKRRHINQRRARVRNMLTEMLTHEQTRKLNGLRRAAAMMPAYEQAMKLNLLGPNPPAGNTDPP